MDAVQVVQEQDDAYNARDLDRIMDCFSPDAVVQDGVGTVLFQGEAAIRAFYGQLFAQSPHLHTDIPGRIHVGSWVIVEEHTTGINLEGFPPDLHAAFVLHVEDRKIDRVMLLS